MRPLLGVVMFGVTSLAASGVAHGVVGRWARRAFPVVARHPRIARLLVGALALVGPVTGVLARVVRRDAVEVVHGAGMIELAACAIAAIPLALLQLFSATARRTALAARERRARDSDLPPARHPDRDRDGDAPPVAVTRREAVERIGGIVVVGATIGAVGWGIRTRHAYVVEELVVRIAGLPRALDGYTIAQVSDLHVGPLLGERELADGFAHVRALRPDLVVATGDLVDADPRRTPMVARALADLRPRDGAYAIFGNHEAYAGAALVRRALEAGGVRPLVNAGAVIRGADGGGFALLGVDDEWAAYARGAASRGPDLVAALRDVPRDLPRILLAHRPTYIARSGGQVALQLSGHTHGGQIDVGVARLFSPYVAGRYDVRGTTLWVNRGFGTVGPPIRLNAPPEITRIVLVSA